MENLHTLQHQQQQDRSMGNFFENEDPSQLTATPPQFKLASSSHTDEEDSSPEGEVKKYEMKGDVGVPKIPNPNKTLQNHPDDVQWVQKRLLELGFLSEEAFNAESVSSEKIKKQESVSTEDIPLTLAAIKTFQIQVIRNVKNGEINSDGRIDRNGKVAYSKLSSLTREDAEKAISTFPEFEDAIKKEQDKRLKAEAAKKATENQAAISQKIKAIEPTEDNALSILSRSLPNDKAAWLNGEQELNLNPSKVAKDVVALFHFGNDEVATKVLNSTPANIADEVATSFLAIFPQENLKFLTKETLVRLRVMLSQKSKKEESLGETNVCINDSIQIIEKELKEWTDDKGRFMALIKKERMTTKEIKEARDYVKGLADPIEKAHFFRILQEKVVYVNQRDNAKEVNGQTFEQKDGGSCNLTSLEMALSGLGIDVKDHPDIPAGQEMLNNVEKLEVLRQQNTTLARTYIGGWGAAAKAAGTNEIEYLMGASTPAMKTKAWWENVLMKEHIDIGHSVTASIHGHIIRIQGINEKGVIVDDPFGKSELGKGTARTVPEINKSNKPEFSYGKSQSEKPNIGEDIVYSWDAIANFTFNWIAFISENEN